ncbi:cell division protein FtsL [Paenibacillus sp. ACRRX]|uniref:cell division protein FtsL n=1 Tax=Paenibacillus sp. ACRRX TaxID=2918206 RepID=UPI001EF60FFA|nr:cell division protein FtsL [Paenibacillus sp. ACRRX]MCG7407804.1 cell division protein FtsL [Paenibacillus sp. ACRRX]
MGYVRGNLAVRPERRPQVQERYKETTKKVVRKASLPMREKMLYLLTIVFYSAVAFMLIARYADIYTLNREIQSSKREVDKMATEMGVLKVKQQQLSDWDRIRQVAEANGLRLPDQPAEIHSFKVDSGNE